MQKNKKEATSENTQGSLEQLGNYLDIIYWHTYNKESSVI